MNIKQGCPSIEFWFDFASGYAYFAALEIEALAGRHGRIVASLHTWCCVQGHGRARSEPHRAPLKGECTRRDWRRSARLKGVVFKLPERHPKIGLAAIRASITLIRLPPPA